MEILRSLAAGLLADGTIKGLLGYEAGTAGRRRPLVATSEEDLARLRFDEACTGNLAGLLAKAELRRLFPLAVLGREATLRSLLQLHAERQLRDGEVIALVVEDGQAIQLATAAALEEHLALKGQGLPAEDAALIARLQAMERTERWAWWQEELGRCIKCYACRQTCPMCYCATCTMDQNRPQWVPVASHALGNFEYHVVRAMHLAGRCVQCGECGRACPVGIPVHLLPMHAQERSEALFGARAGRHAKLDYALGVFRPDDKETFIR